MTASIHDALSAVLAELLDGASPDSGWVLNPADPGILRPLRALSAEDASRIPPGGTSSIAAHVDHLRYGLNLWNRWSNGESPFADADWSASWKRTAVSDREWAALVQELEREGRTLHRAFQTRRELRDDALTGYVAVVVHLAYHVGAIRQMSQALRGPRSTGKA